MDWIVKALRGIARSNTIRALFRMSQPRYADTTDECRSAWRIPSAYLKSAETCRNHLKPTLRPTMSNYVQLYKFDHAALLTRKNPWVFWTLGPSGREYKTSSSECHRCHLCLAAEGDMLQYSSPWDLRHSKLLSLLNLGLKTLGLLSWNSDDDSLAWLSSLELQLLQLSQPETNLKGITLLRVIPTMTLIHFVTGKSSGILSDIFSGIRSGILSGISSGILPGISSGRCSGISSGRCSGISSGISSGICSGISSGIPSGILSGISSGILSGKSSGIPPGILSSISSGILSGKSAGILSGKHSGTLSGISSGILSDILSGILSGIPSGILSGISSNILSGISSGTLCGISFGVDTRGWGPAGNTGRGWSWLRSGREHWAGILAVEVRQGTLGVDGPGWGPAGNTGRGWSWLRSGRAHWRGWSWLRSGRAHWAWMVVVEVRQRTLWIAGRSWTRRTRRTTRRRRTRRRRRGGRGGRGGGRGRRRRQLT